MKTLPPLDTHAHVDASLSARALEDLGAVVCIATRSLAEFELVKHRQDLVSIWGLGCHPSLVGAQKTYDPELFEQAITGTSYIAEVGLDGVSRVPLDRQKDTLRSILSIVSRHPRIVSLHSNGVTDEVISLLEEYGRQPGRILHWWLGDEDSTERAIAINCYFSVNYSMLRNASILRRIPIDRILFETDHPSGDRFSPRPRMPGGIQVVERALAEMYGITPHELRKVSWKNFANLVAETHVYSLLPEPIQKMVDSIDL